MNLHKSPLDSSDVGETLGTPVQLAPSVMAGSSVGAIVQIIVGAIDGALVGAGVAITLTRIHTPRGPTVETNTSTQESDATQQQVVP